MPQVQQQLQYIEDIKDKNAHWDLGGIVVPHCGIVMFTPNQMETHGCVISSVFDMTSYLSSHDVSSKGSLICRTSLSFDTRRLSLVVVCQMYYVLWL